MKNYTIKAIFCTQQKKDGTTYKVVKTILKTGEWVLLKFDKANINVNAWKGKNQLLSVTPENVEHHSEYTDKEGKLHKAYFWISNIVSAEPLQVKRKAVDMSIFEVDVESPELTACDIIGIPDLDDDLTGNAEID